MWGWGAGLALRALLAVALVLAPGAAFADDAKTLMTPLPLTATGQPVPGYPNGAPASPPDLFRFTDAEIAKLKAGRFKAGIAMQALDTPWNSLQVEAITATLARYGVEVVAVTDAAQNPSRQAAHLASMIDRKVNVVFSVPIDPATQTAAYRRLSAAGIKLVFMDNVVHNMTPGKDYVTVVASDNEKNAMYATEELIKAIGGSGEVGLLTYFYDSYYSIAARKQGFEKVLAANPGVKLAATDRFTQPREVYDKTIAMLRAHPNIKGIFAVWGDPAMQAVAAAKAIGRNDLVVTTNDLGPDTALYVARGEILAIGAQLPYDLGVAEANAAAYALLGKPVPPYISLPALRVKKANLISALELVTKRTVPEEVKAACGNACQ
ncbi:MAG TPA: substrate-binding domain-containing protein [Bradyrhizobium sp.]|nr:substrate-binding domain-containing protein [Bradyrhizobium sp.]